MPLRRQEEQSMAQYDPAMRREIWLFQEIARHNKRGRILKRLGYVLVSYDDDPQQFVEPVPADPFIALNAPDGTNTGSGCRVIDPRVDGLGRIADFRFFNARPFEVVAFNDVDAANNIGQLQNLDSMGRPISATA